METKYTLYLDRALKFLKLRLYFNETDGAAKKLRDEKGMHISKEIRKSPFLMNTFLQARSEFQPLK